MSLTSITKIIVCLYSVYRQVLITGSRGLKYVRYILQMYLRTHTYILKAPVHVGRRVAAALSVKRNLTDGAI